MSLSISYGNELESINITRFILKHCVDDKTLLIPKEGRLELFGENIFDKDNCLVIRYKDKKITTYEDVKLNISEYLERKVKPKTLEITVLYGIKGFYRDITQVAFDKCCRNGLLYIPTTDESRDILFGDPIYGFLKHIKLITNNKSRMYSDKEAVVLDVTDARIIPLENENKENEEAPCVRLAKIHANLKFLYGNLYDEYPEQLLAVTYIKKNRKVLEVGSNIGRNTSIIVSLLENQENLVTLECDPGTFAKLLTNRNINNFKYRAENVALSYKPLILKSQDCIGFTKNSEKEEAGFVKVNTITFEELEAKYNIKFDTLVVDCEGALYYILMDNPNILNNISLIIMENDYHNIEHKYAIDKIMKSKGLTRTYFEGGGWGPCYNNFYEVWERLI